MKKIVSILVMTIFCSLLMVAYALSDEEIAANAEIQKYEIEPTYNRMNFPFVPEFVSINEDGFVAVAYSFAETRTTVLFEPDKYENHTTFACKNPGNFAMELQGDELFLYFVRSDYKFSYDFDGNLLGIDRDSKREVSQRVKELKEQVEVEVGENILTWKKGWFSYTLFLNGEPFIQCGAMATMRTYFMVLCIIIIMPIGAFFVIRNFIRVNTKKPEQET